MIIDTPYVITSTSVICNMHYNLLNAFIFMHAFILGDRLQVGGEAVIVLSGEITTN
jgi:hypothetical protein